MAKSASAKVREKPKESPEKLQHSDTDLFDRYMNWLVKLPKQKGDVAEREADREKGRR